MKTPRYETRLRFDRHPIHDPAHYYIIVDANREHAMGAVLNARGVPRKFWSEQAAARAARKLTA